MNSYLTENMVAGVLVYTCIQTPVNKYQSNEKEWKVGVVVSEDVADEWEELYTKQAPKTMLNKKFKEQYNIAAPFEDQKKQYVVTLKKGVILADGKPVPEIYHPKVLIDGENGKLKDITKTTLVGNGSEGIVSFETYANDYGTFVRLKNVKVNELIEYTSNAVGGSEFGEVEESDEPGGEFGQQEEPDYDDVPEVEVPEEEEKPKRTRRKKVVKSDDEDDDDPFG